MQNLLNYKTKNTKWTIIYFDVIRFHSIHTPTIHYGLINKFKKHA